MKLLRIFILLILLSGIRFNVVEADDVIRIGVTSTSTEDLESANAIAAIAKDDINAYLWDQGAGFSVEFVVRDNQASAAKALENTQYFKSQGIDLVIGHGWSGQCSASLSYVNENNMLLISPSSTSPLLSIAGDKLFRTCPNDFAQGPALAEMWDTWGIRAVLVMQRGDAWGDGLFNILEDELDARGIDLLGKIRYAPESTEFSSYLDLADGILGEAIAEYGGAQYVGFQLMSFSEDRIVQTQAADYPNLMDVIWMSTESGGRSERMLDETGELCVQTRHFSPFMGFDESNPEYVEFEDRYIELTGYYPSFYDAVHYDAFRLLVKCILETGSTDAGLIADAIIPLSETYSGLTGNLALDETGDRIPQLHDIWGYYELAPGDNWYRIWGQHDGRSNEVEWDDQALSTFAGIIRPALDVEDAIIELSPMYGTPGTVVTITGRGFSSTGTIYIYLESQLSECEPNDAGNFAGTIVIPPLEFGITYDVIARQLDSGIEASAPIFVALMVLQLSEFSAPLGTNVTLMGSGFSPGGTVDVYFGSDFFFSYQLADDISYFSVMLQVPDVPSGTYTITVFDILVGFGAGIDFTVTQAEGPNDDTPSGAIRIDNDTPYHGEIDPAEDVDYYSFIAYNGVTYNLQTSGYTDTFMELYSTDGVTLLLADDDEGEGYNAYIEWRCRQSGIYYIKIRHFRMENTGSYAITASGDLEYDSLELSEYYEREIESEGDVDYYIFSALNGEVYIIETFGPTDTYMELYIPDGTTLIVSDDDSGDDSNALIEWECTQSGNYYIMIRHYTEEGTGSYGISVTIPSYILTVESDYGTTSGSGSYSAGASATFSVNPSTVSGETGVRYRFYRWTSSSPTDNTGYTGSNNPASISMYGDVVEEAVWTTQYYLSMDAGGGGTVSPVSGWYDAGSRVTISATPSSEYDFVGWDGGGLGAYSGTLSGYSLIINGPISQIAEFVSTPMKTLSLRSVYGSVSGAGEYPVGFTATFRVSPDIVEEGGIRHTFTGWFSGSTGGYTGSDNPASIVLERDISEVAQWKTQYYLSLDSPLETEGQGWYDTNEFVTLQVPPPSGFLIRTVFVRWEGDAEWTGDALYLPMDSPKNIVAICREDYTQLYMAGLGTVVLLLIVVPPVVRRRKRIRFQYIKTELEEKLLDTIMNVEPIILETYTGPNQDISIVREVLENLIETKKIEGWYTEDATEYYTRAVLRGIVLRQVSLKNVVSIDELEEYIRIPGSVITELIQDEISNGRFEGHFSNDGSTIFTSSGIRDRILRYLKKSDIDE